MVSIPKPINGLMYEYTDNVSRIVFETMEKHTLYQQKKVCDIFGNNRTPPTAEICF